MLSKSSIRIYQFLGKMHLNKKFIQISIQIQMKIIVKNKNTMKLYSGEISYDKLQEFLLKEFPEQNQFNLYYEDSEGDKIALSCSEDLEVMKELLKGKQYVKVTYTKVQNSSSSQEKMKKEKKKNFRRSKEKEEKFQKKEEVVEEKKQEKDLAKQNEEQKFDFKQYKHMQRKFFKRAVKKTIGSSSSGQSQSKQKQNNTEFKNQNQNQRKIKKRCYKMAKTFQGAPQTYLEFVKENIELKFWESANLYSEKNNIPLENKLKSKVEKKIKKLSEFFSKASENFSQIVNQNPNIHFREILKLLKQRGFEVFDQCKERCHKYDWKKHCHRERSKGNSEEKSEYVLTRRCAKLVKIFGGNTEDYLEFVKKTIDMNMPDVVSGYAKANNIDLEVSLKDKIEEKINKLSLFFNKPAQNYKSIVAENPTTHFRGIIKILKEKGIQDFGDQNFKQMREKLKEKKKNEHIEKKEKKESKSKSIKKDKVQNKKVEIKQNKSKEKKVKSKEQKMKQIGIIVAEMKDIFGSQQEKDYFQFIEQNIEEGKDQIINKWIETRIKK